MLISSATAIRASVYVVGARRPHSMADSVVGSMLHAANLLSVGWLFGHFVEADSKRL